MSSRLVLGMTRIGPAASVIVFLEWAFLIGMVLVAQADVAYADSTADWLVASAARDGLDPFADMRVLSEVYEVDYTTPLWDDAGDKPWIHPRTPAALLVMQPLTFLSPSVLLSGVIWASLGFLGVMGLSQLSRLSSKSWWVGTFFAAGVVVSAPVVRTAQFGAWSVFLALLIGATWVTVRSDDSWLAGLWLGLAIALRLFPGLLLIPLLLFRRWKAAGGAVVMAIALNLIALPILGLSGSSVISGLGDAGDVWVDLRGNGSLVGIIHRVLPWPVMGIVVIVVLLALGHLYFLHARRAGFELVFASVVVWMLLASPLSWEHYDVMLFGVVAYLIGQRFSRIGRAAALVWILAMTLGFLLRQPLEQGLVLAAGLPSFLGRCLLLVALTHMGLQEHRSNADRLAASSIGSPQTIPARHSIPSGLS